MSATPPAGPVARDVAVESARFVPGERPTLTLSGTGRPGALVLRGPRQDLPGTVIVDGDGWRAEFPLLVSRWRGALLPAPSGSYTAVQLADDGSAAPLHAAEQTSDDILVPGWLRATAAVVDGVLRLELVPPLTDAERGRENQAALENDYRSAKRAPLDAVFFESFYGQSATCNPLALDREFAATRPDIARYWSVVDASVEVPEGSVALIEGSAEWWRIRGSARLLVVNDWLRNRFARRRFQTVLQTWHGTPLKKIALGRPGVGLRTALATIRERGRWSIMLSQNAHSTAVFRSAYAFLGPIWQEGYPRDDALVSPDPDAVRERLGLPRNVTVLLYAPTWRDDRPEHIDHLDVAAFTDALGPGYVTLIRGHSRTLLPGRDVRASNILDVTGYPDVTELFLVADALITDYSSVMFDFSVTGKPMFFFAPDLDHYREQLRGFYFDLDAAAPGPVVQDAAELVGLVRDRDASSGLYAEKYAAWRERFNPRDDGGSAARVVARLLKRGAVG
ncbi:CDP-glycerol glycerophosphotransferase [Conyzicola lurida]|uniref:CDP-glycerol glycerophosphotransferase n=1 Tax=Conyzicola lurida TaxID=1172621 RepID=A0A841AH16_9MICO|nr:CDP-glycerol glycerophosphotransferase family protein [Conyzicola lurida]MBB5842507.1 CDP-glycerol glycerophosphotransferase [Conyzicola lurida]